jgi:hypothetical protein
MLSLEDKEFIRMWVELHPEVEGSHTRAIKAAICLTRLLNLARETGPIDINPAAVKEATLGMHEIGKELTPDEVKQLMEMFNYATEVAD